MKVAIASVVALLLAGASTPSGPSHSPEAQAKLDKLLAGRVAGEEKACVPVDRTKNAIAIDESTIVFRDGPRVWLNNLKASNGCSMIGHPYAMAQEHFTLFLVQKPRGWTLQSAWPQLKRFN